MLKSRCTTYIRQHKIREPLREGTTLKDHRPAKAHPERKKRKYASNFLHRGDWWVAWTDDLPGALTQGRTLEEARENLKDAIALMLEPVALATLPKAKTRLVREVLEV
jgi:predicted RNase H-like HicB family nuclease